MRLGITAAGIAACGAVAAGVLVIAAQAETTGGSAPTQSAPVRTVSVQGVASAPLSATASTETAVATYRQAMAAAIADGHAKAQWLAEKAGATLGVAQSVGEGGGYIQCGEDVEYQGGQPDFGSGAPVWAGAVSAPAARPAPALHRPVRAKRHHRATAKRAAAESCTLSTQVALVYQLG